LDLTDREFAVSTKRTATASPAIVWILTDRELTVSSKRTATVSPAIVGIFSDPERAKEQQQPTICRRGDPSKQHHSHSNSKHLVIELSLLTAETALLPMAEH
jgi:hypothetical protein